MNNQHTLYYLKLINKKGQVGYKIGITNESVIGGRYKDKDDIEVIKARVKLKISTNKELISNMEDIIKKAFKDKLFKGETDRSFFKYTKDTEIFREDILGKMTPAHILIRSLTK